MLKRSEFLCLFMSSSSRFRFCAQARSSVMSCFRGLSLAFSECARAPTHPASIMPSFASILAGAIGWSGLRLALALTAGTMSHLRNIV